MKMNIKSLVSNWQNCAPRAVWLKAGLVFLAAFIAVAGKAQTNFANAEVISGDWGSVTNDNTGVTPDTGAPSNAGYAPHAPLWYRWQAPFDGVVEMDNVGSGISVTNYTFTGFDTNFMPIFLTNVTFVNLDTVLGVYTGTNLASLNQVAANDDLFPINKTGSSSQGASTTQLTDSGNADYIQVAGQSVYSFAQPYYGPSGLRFNAKGGQVYYIAVDSKISSGTGPILLSWAYKSSGVFRFASEDEDPLTGLLLYQTAGTESQPVQGTSGAGNSTVLTYYNYNVPGVLVTVTRAAGSTGRAMVSYSTVDGTNLALSLPNDTPGYAGIDYAPVSGTLIFDDYEMSKKILIPVYPPSLFPGDQTNRVFGIQLTNVVLDPNEVAANAADVGVGPQVSAPRVDQVFSTAMVRILNPYADPYGPETIPLMVTNIVGMTTNIYSTNVLAFYPTNVIFNFEKANYRVPADVNDPTVSQWTQVTLWVERFGTNNASQQLFYRVNNELGSDSDPAEEQNIFFPLQPGSDYAVPTPPQWGGIRGANSDFVLTQGSISFPSSGLGAIFQPITFTVPTSTLTKFNKDFKVQIYKEVQVGGQTVPELVGMINEATVTILFNDENPPAGSVDEFYNADFNSQLALYASQRPITTPKDDQFPGVSGEVYGMTILPNNETFIGGDFQSYNGLSFNGVNQSCVALVDTNGQLDTSFYPGTGCDGAVYAVAASGSQFYIGGSFATYDGTSVGHLARLNADGSLDSSFTTLGAADGTVRAMAVMANGEVLIAGEFTHVNGAAINHIALLHTDGTLDTSFNPGNNINGTVYAVAIYNTLGGQQVVVGGSFTVPGQLYQNIARLNLDGSLDAGFNPGTGADSVVHALAVQVEGQILVAGEFTHFNGSTLNRIARLNSNGSLDSTNFFIGTGADAPVFCINPMTVITATNYVTDPITGNITTNYTYGTGGVYVGGAFASINGTHRLGFARLYANGNVDTTFMDTAYNQFAGLKRVYSFDAPAVLATAVQSDGNVLIGGLFSQVGGGQANTNVCNSLDDQLLVTEGLVVPESFADPNLWVEPKTRDGVRNRSGFARLIGGATPGPGNIGLNQSSFSANKSQTALSVSLVRTNGILGPAGANFSVQPGLAQPGSDYSYNSGLPLFWVASQFTVHESRERTDGLSGLSGFLIDPYGLYLTASDAVLNQLPSVTVSIIKNKQNPGNLDAKFQLANPSGADTFYLGGENIPLGAALGISSAPFTLVDDTSYPGTFGFSSSTYVATNLSAPISILRSNGVFGQVSMFFSTTNGTALAGTDYVGITNKSVVFPGNVVSNGVTITVKNNGYITNVEKTVNLALFGLSGTPGATLGISNAVLRIINPNAQGYITLGATNFTGAISSGVLNFVVNRVAGSYGTITVQYATTNGTAINGTDYTGATNTLTWNSGDVSPRVVSIPLMNPGVIGTGVNKQFSVTLFNPMLNSASAPSLFASEITNATLTITNDNRAGTLQFSAGSYLVNEIGGYATVSVVRTGGAGGTVSAQFSTSDGTATNGVNYVATNGTITLLAGQTIASFNVPILNLPDGAVVDPPPSGFYFNVSLTGSSGLTNATVHILDESYNYPPGSPDTLYDTNGMNADVLTLALQSSGQILAGGNFTAVGPVPESRLARLNTDGTLDTSFLNGLSGANAPVNVVVDQSDDRILIGGAFTTVDGIRRNFLTRLMTDGTVDTSFNPGSGPDNAVNAIAETFINGVRRVYIGGAFGNVAGTASPGVARLKADISDNNNQGAVDPGFNIGSGVDGQVYAIAVYPTNSIYAGKVLIGGSFAHFNGVAVTNLARLNVDGSLDTTFDANLGTGPNDVVRALAIQLGGQVLVGGRFTSFNGTAINRICRLNTDGTLDTNFLAAVGSGADATVLAITLQPDNRIVLGGSFAHVNGLNRNHITRLLPTGAPDPTINFGSGANGDVDAVIVQPTDGFLLIAGAFTEYDGQACGRVARIYGGSETGSGDFTFSTGDFQVYENAVYAPITILRTGGTSGTNADGSGNISVHFTANTASGGTAVVGVNYEPVAEDVVFPAGEVQQTVLVPVLDDGVVTTNPFTVNLTLSNPTPPATNGVQPIATLTILEADTAIAFSQPFYIVDKNTPSGLATLDVFRFGGLNNTSTVAFYTPTNGTAVVGTDYYPTNATVTFLPGQSDVQVQVPIINNTNIEGNRTINLVVTNAVNASLESPSNSVLVINDTVTAPGELFFGAPNFTATADQGYAYLPVLRTNASSGTTVSVSYTLTPGSAQPGVNYVNRPGTLQFGPGVMSNAVPVQLVNSGIIQGPVSLTVSLSSPSGGAALLAPTNTVLTILNTNAVFAFTQATNTVPEDAGLLNVVVSRYNNTNMSASVQYATTNGTAVAGVNYYNTFGTLTFNPGEAFKSILVPLINQSNITDMTFGINLFNPVNGYVVPPSNTVVVLQASAAGLSFTTNSTTVFKNGGSATFTVVCSNPRVEPVVINSNIVPLQVTYVTVDGTAKAGINYNASSGTLVFTNGIGTNTFTVPILNNNLVSSNLAFSVLLTNVTAPGRIMPYGAEVVTIKESNAGMRFSQPAYTVYKNGVFATINVYRTGYTDNVATVNYSVTNGTAIAGQNFYPTNGTLIFTNGITSQSFSVPLIANSQVQPNLYALLELSNPTNSVLVDPSVATLTILETGGSFVQPAGSQVVTNYTSHLSDGIIGSNDTVQVLFAFRDAAGLNVTNLVAYLLATNGVTFPSPASQTYGPLTVYGHSVSRPFTFTAHGTNSLAISPTFQLYDNGKFIGPATFTYTVGSVTTTFANTNPIIINDGTNASPYPSVITVSGVGSILVKATVTITNLSHQNFSDIDALVVSPTTNTLIMGHVGGGFPARNITLTFDDAPTNSPYSNGLLPRNGTIVTSTNKPTQYYPVPNFP